MRTAFFILAILLVCPPAFTQTHSTTAKQSMPVDADTKLIQYREIIDEPGSKDVLYDRGAEWFRHYYKSPTSVFRIQDKVNGRLEGTGRIGLVYKDETGLQRESGVVLYEIKLELKDNKYRVTLTDFNLKGSSRYPIEKWMNKSDPAYNVSWDSYLYQVDTTMRSLIRDLKKEMKPKVIKKDEW